jgi:hypothetical protein
MYGAKKRALSQRSFSRKNSQFQAAFADRSIAARTRAREVRDDGDAVPRREFKRKKNRT